MEIKLPKLKLPKIKLLSAIVCFVVAGALLAFTFFSFSLNYQLKPYAAKLLNLPESPEAREMVKFEKSVLPAEGVILPVKWGDLGVRMIKAGVIDQAKFEDLYVQRGGLDEATKKLLTGSDNSQLVITKDNANSILNLLWALGLGNKNTILEKGPMMTYSGAGSPTEALAKAGGFASTGGWTLGQGDALTHYSRHQFFSLTPEQQQLVEKTSWNIYRSCCSNPTYFPDCNHGMAMLGLLELMASQGVNEADMYKAALAVNSYWFPETYINLAKYFDSVGTPWKKVDPKEVLGADYSSASGYRNILNKIKPVEQKSGGSCGV